MEKIKLEKRIKSVLLREETHTQLVKMQIDLAYHEKRKLSLEGVISHLLKSRTL
jgi:hypothetical protein